MISSLRTRFMREERKRAHRHEVRRHWCGHWQWRRRGLAEAGDPRRQHRLAHALFRELVPSSSGCGAEGNGCTRGAKVAAEGGEGEGVHAGELRCCDVLEPRELKTGCMGAPSTEVSPTGPRLLSPKIGRDRPDRLYFFLSLKFLSFSTVRLFHSMGAVCAFVSPCDTLCLPENSLCLVLKLQVGEFSCIVLQSTQSACAHHIHTPHAHD
jgi:hypothetical protein